VERPGIVCEVFAEVLRPIDRAPTWQWAEKHVRVDKNSPFPGAWRLANSPFVKELMEVFPDNTVKDIAVMCSAQSAKTLTIMILVLWAAENDPGPAMWVQAAKDEADTFVNTRLLPMFEACPPVARKLLSRQGGDKARHKVKLSEIGLTTMSLFVTGSNSPSKLKSKPIRWLFLDEVTEYPPGALDGVSKRVRAFWNSRRVMLSTPKEENDVMHVAFKEGDQREWHFHCPRCGFEQPLALKQLRACRRVGGREEACDWKDVPGALDGGKVWAFDTLAEALRYECAFCGHLMADEPKVRQHIATAGRWVRMNPSAPKTKVSFHWNAMLPPIVKWRAVVEEKIIADRAVRLGDIEPLKKFITETLGEPWQDRLREFDDFSVLEDRKRDYPLATRNNEDGTWHVHVEEGDTLFLAFDVQEKPHYHYRYVCRAFASDGMTSRLVSFGKIGAEEEAEALRAALGVPTINTVIDSAHDSGRVYKACIRFKWKAFRGDDRSDFMAAVEVEEKGVTVKRTVRRVWSLSHADPAIGTSMQGKVRPIKLYLWSNPGVKDILGLAMSGVEQEWTIPAEVPRDYLQQITAEAREEQTDARGRVRYVWVRKRKDNHYFDCECMIMASAIMAKKVGRMEEAAEKELSAGVEGAPSG
jgi:phage terminase large subunit GpA-like protein